MKSCILRERLYVPEHYVENHHLKAFTHYFEVKDHKRDQRGVAVGLESGLQQVKTHIQITAADGANYVGFARGNLPKLAEFFGQYEWDDRTVAPPFVSALAFKKDRQLYTFEKDGIGQQEVVDKFLKIQSGVIKAAPRFGKTICTVYILTKMGIKALIVAHQEDLLHQFYKEFEEFSNLLEIRNPSKKRRDAKGHIVGFFSAFDNPEELDVCLLCWQTFGSKYGAERIKKHRDTWGVVVADECLDPSTMIATPSGHKELRDIQVGDEVITPTGDIAKVKNRWEVEKEAHKFVFESGLELIASENHLLATLACTEKNYRSDAAYRRIKPAIECDNVERYAAPLKIRSEIKWESYFLGWSIGNGILPAGGGLKFSFKDGEKISLFEYVINNLGYEYVKSENTRGDTTFLFSDVFASFFAEKYGFKPGNTTLIPQENYLSLDVDVLRGLYDANAAITDAIEFETVSKSLALQVHSMLSSLGILAIFKIIERDNKETRYRVNITKTWQFLNQIGFGLQSKVSKANQLCDDKNVTRYRDIVQEVLPLGSRTLVDIELDNEERLFIANGLVSHNCHFVGASKYAGIINNLNGRHRLGLTGTLERVDHREKIVLDIVGPVAAKGLVKQVPCVVVITHTNIPVKYQAFEPLPYLFKRLYNNPERTALILKQLEEDVRDGFWICIGFHRSSQTQLQHFTDLLKSMGYAAEAFYGGMKRNREEVLEEFRNGTVQVAVCNEAMLTGINIPRWNAYYSMFPVANVVLRKDDEDTSTKELSGNFKQKFDRIRTPFNYSETMKKKVGLIRDWTDKNAQCVGMFKKRLKAYKNQGFQIEEIHFSRKERIDV